MVRDRRPVESLVRKHRQLGSPLIEALTSWVQQWRLAVIDQRQHGGRALPFAFLPLAARQRSSSELAVSFFSVMLDAGNECDDGDDDCDDDGDDSDDDSFKKYLSPEFLVATDADILSAAATVQGATTCAPAGSILCP
jgi:hypothetical protein